MMDTLQLWLLHDILRLDGDRYGVIPHNPQRTIRISEFNRRPDTSTKRRLSGSPTINDWLRMVRAFSRSSKLGQGDYPFRVCAY